jgi:acyl homoserine lactone synthase
MQAVAVTPDNYSKYQDLLSRMFQLRHHAFKERLNWRVSVSGGREFDTYDMLGPTYLLVVRSPDSVIGSLRLLPTVGPTMLGQTFSALLAGAAAPSAPDLLECSRLCVDTTLSTEMTGGGLNKATFVLLSALIEWGLLRHSRQIVAVIDLRMERILRRAGWTISRIAPPVRLADSFAVAGTLEVSQTIAERIRAKGELASPVFLQSVQSSICGAVEATSPN